MLTRHPKRFGPVSACDRAVQRQRTALCSCLNVRYGRHRVTGVAGRGQQSPLKQTRLNADQVRISTDGGGDIIEVLVQTLAVPVQVTPRGREQAVDVPREARSRVGFRATVGAALRTDDPVGVSCVTKRTGSTV